MVWRTKTLAGRQPVRQWVLSMAKRLRQFLPNNPTVKNLGLHIFLSAVEQGTQAAYPAAHDDPAPPASPHAYAGNAAEIQENQSFRWRQSDGGEFPLPDVCGRSLLHRVDILVRSAFGF